MNLHHVFAIGVQTSGQDVSTNQILSIGVVLIDLPNRSILSRETIGPISEIYQSLNDSIDKFVEHIKSLKKKYNMNPNNIGMVINSRTTERCHLDMSLNHFGHPTITELLSESPAVYCPITIAELIDQIVILKDCFLPVDLQVPPAKTDDYCYAKNHAEMLIHYINLLKHRVLFIEKRRIEDANKRSPLHRKNLKLFALGTIIFAAILIPSYFLQKLYKSAR
ncbi:MAG: hypothetical protein Harvfovirus1_60 [Harvfovirus sp.]|uniref:Uncharacterized protein n=1 Tax=Harvfovirus sp. TaxID=2487768 RepID=A0A3G4ZZS5_9VIRU|nr:MAG: hypothetical protein Harvfovirus1_60 [Harvfovirus sp.]